MFVLSEKILLYLPVFPRQVKYQKKKTLIYTFVVRVGYVPQERLKSPVDTISQY